MRFYQQYKEQSIKPKKIVSFFNKKKNFENGYSTYYVI